MSARRSRLALIAVVAACVFITVGCGGGGSDDASDADQTTRSTSKGSGSGDSGSGSAAGGFFANADCRQLAKAFDSSGLGSAFSSGDDPTKDLQAAADFLDQAADEAPQEISGDVQVVADAYHDLAKQTSGVDWAGLRNGNPAAIASVSQFGQAFANPDLTDALQNLSKYVTENCVNG
jgi:hypothetical protein